MAKKTKVLIATGEMNAGGAETLIMELLRQKSEQVEYTLLIHYRKEFVEGVFDPEIKDMGIPMIYIQSVGSSGEKKYIRDFCEMVARAGPFDVVHSHLNGAGGIIAKAARAAGIKNRVVHCHADITFKGSMRFRLLSEIKLQAMRFYIDKYATAYWACSQAAAERLFFRKRQAQVVIIPNVINVKEYLKTEESVAQAKQKFDLPAGTVLGAVGRITPIKNYLFIPRLLGVLKQKGYTFPFVCFGRVVDEAYYQEVLQLAKEEGVASQMHFLGNSTNVARDIHCIDVFLMPSFSEGFGMAAIESQAAAIPTITSTGVPEMIDVKAGLIDYIALDKVEQWAEKIIKLSREKPLIDNRKLLQCFVQKKFDSVTAVQTIEKKYITMNQEDK